MIVCEKCVKLGSISWEAKPQKRMKIGAKPLPPKPSTKKPSIEISEELELREDFSPRIRQAREKMRLSHEDLGKKIGEKVSVLRKIEGGKMTPNHKLAEKLEHALKVKLLVPLSEPKASSVRFPSPHKVTLGEVIRLKKKETEATENESNHSPAATSI